MVIALVVVIGLIHELGTSNQKSNNKFESLEKLLFHFNVNIQMLGSLVRD